MLVIVAVACCLFCGLSVACGALAIVFGVMLDDSAMLGVGVGLFSIAATHAGVAVICTELADNRKRVSQIMARVTHPTRRSKKIPEKPKSQ